MSALSKDLEDGFHHDPPYTQYPPGRSLYPPFPKQTPNSTHANQRHSYPTRKKRREKKRREEKIFISSPHARNRSRDTPASWLPIPLFHITLPFQRRRRRKTDTRTPVLTRLSGVRLSSSVGTVCGRAARDAARGAAKGLSDVPLAFFSEPP